MTTITTAEVFKRLIAEGYENVHGDHHQIIVNNRGEIDIWDGQAMINNRLDPDRKYDLYYTDINKLMLEIQSSWTRKEPK